MGATAIVTGVLAQFQKFFDVEVPGLEISAYRALALAALINRDCGVVDDLQKRNNALTLAVRPFDMTSQRPDSSPVVPQTTGELRQQGIFFDGLVDAIEIVSYGGQVTA